VAGEDGLLEYLPKDEQGRWEHPDTHLAARQCADPGAPRC
jgi:hypothetical protein